MIRVIPLAILAIFFQMAPALEASSGDPNYDRFYEIEEPQAINSPDELNPIHMLAAIDSVAVSAVSLMDWALNREAWPQPNEAYDRRKQFGTWLGGHDSSECVNTRGEVLIRDSDGPVEMSKSGCMVKKGRWHDPYTGQDITEASQMQIDHVVPLKEAYISGAWKWDNRTRCAFTNFMANSSHLLSVSGHENMSKGDSNPAQWMPPNADFTCSYLKDWLEVKLIWGLIMNPDETRAIKSMFNQARCDLKVFRLNRQELLKMRAAIVDTAQNCPQ